MYVIVTTDGRTYLVDGDHDGFVDVAVRRRAVREDEGALEAVRRHREVEETDHVLGWEARREGE
jgi:hypothetical protein